MAGRTGASRLRGWVGRALALAIGSALAIGLLEVGLRWLRPGHSGVRALLYQATLPTEYGRVAGLPALMETTVVGFAPHAEYAGYVLNARSLRTREYAVGKGSNVFRVAALGDSFVYGGVAEGDHWCGQLEQGLAARRGGAVEVLRMGVPGTGPPFYLRMWEVEAASLRPDVVIVGVYVGNDFFDEQGRADGWRGGVERVAAVSYAARLARNLLRLDAPVFERTARAALMTRDSGGFDVPSYAYDDTKPTFSAGAFAEVERDHMTLCLDSARTRFGWRLERVMRVLREMHAQVARSEARLVVLVIPDEYQVHADVAALAARAEGRTLHAYDLERPQRELTRALTDEGIEWLDLLPSFREHADGERLYVPRDTHWNRAGHRLAAAQLLARLEHARP